MNSAPATPGGPPPPQAPPRHARRLPAACLLPLLSCTLAAAGPAALDLAGSWRFALDPQDLGLAAGPANWKFPDTIQLPGCLQAQGFGEIPSLATRWTGDGWRYPELFKEWQADANFKFPFFLQPPRHYLGPAWFQRDIDIPADWLDCRTLLHLERVHWQSSAWIDGRPAGSCDSLGTPHQLDLGILTPGRHALTLRIDNRLAPVNVGPLSHSVTDHTQGNWNGAVGRLELRRAPLLRIAAVAVFPSLDGRVRVEVDLDNLHFDPLEGTVTAEVLDPLTGAPLAAAEDRFSYPRGTTADGRHLLVTSDRRTLACTLPATPAAWDEFSPTLYQVRVTARAGGGADEQVVPLGFREVSNNHGVLTLNGRRIFLRGTLECCIFPLTGHPPTDVGAWRRIVRTCKEHGLNHIRFHSWCPPEAAFVAADELGFYYQVEVSSWANQGAEIGSGRPLDAWLEAETRRVLAACGNHPSFLMLAYGNEPAGPNHQQWLQQWVARRRQEDPRRLYTTAAGWPVLAGSDFHSSPDPRIQAWGGGLDSLLNATPPATDFDWAEVARRHPDAPVVSHEIGQWCVYPNFAEIGKYTGHFRARNLEIFRETARRNGLLGQAGDFLAASGRWQAACYKHDIEAALRTPGFGGFQLLDLHDFPGQGTALVGVLDAFWDAKGYVTPAEFRRFCGPVVPLARLPKMVFTTAETLEARAELAHFGPADFSRLGVEWRLATAAGATVARGTLPARDLPAGHLHQLGRLRVPLAQAPAPAKLTLTLAAPDAAFSNSWDVFVYPAGAPREAPPGGHPGQPDAPGPLTCPSLADALAALDQGRTVLWLPPAAEIADDPRRPLVAGFSPIFWNTAWTNWQPPHTLGLLVNPAHPLFASFPTDAHTNWQWWELQHRTRPFILTDLRGLAPLVQVIDDWVTNRKLGYVFEARVGKGRLVACGFDLEHDLDRRPAARQFRAALLAYLAGPSFQPATTLDRAALEALVKPPSAVRKLGATARATSAEPGYQPAAAIDGDPATFWHTEFSDRRPEPPHDLTLTWREPAPVSALLLTQRQDRNANGQADEVEVLGPDHRILARSRLPRDAAAHRVDLPAGTRLAALTIRLRSSHAGPYGALAEVELVP